MSTIDLLEYSALAQPNTLDAELAAALFSPLNGLIESLAEEAPATVFIDHPLPLVAPSELAVSASGRANTSFLTTQLLTAEPAIGQVTVLALPSVADANSSLLGTLDSTDRQVLQALYQTFLRLDDHYVEGADLLAISEILGLQEEAFCRILERLDWRGYLRLSRTPADRIELAETTFRGMDAFCRAYNSAYPALLREIASLVVLDGVRDGVSLARSIPSVPGLVIAHAVESLAQGGLLHCSHQSGEVCGFEIGHVSPELVQWVAEISGPGTRQLTSVAA